MKYRILVREYQSDREIELCRVKDNPDDIVKAARAKTLRISAGFRKWVRVPKYHSVRYEELSERTH